MAIGKRGANHWGAGLAYGAFGTWMTSAARKGRLAIVAATAADHAERNVVLKTGSVVFGREMRPGGTNLEAGSNLAGLTYGRFRRLVRGMGHSTEGSQQGRPVRLSDAVARQIQARLDDRVDCGGAALLLGVHRSAAAEIIASDLFPPSLDPERRARGEYTVERTAVAAFVAGFEPARETGARPDDARPVMRAATAAGASLVEVLRWVREGRVPVVGVDAQAVGLRRLMVLTADVSRARMPDASGMTKKEAAERLGTKREAVRQLIELGYLRAENHSGVHWIRTEDVHAFEARFVRGPDVAARLGVHALSVPGRLARFGVEPAIGRDRCQMTFYERARVEAVLAAHRRRAACRRHGRLSAQA
ncbi:hypothetical protein [uncultured Methylobacterium sp.]|uniref:hypothetical protein n=1 Tax=uncultured Methylobacterium sp. TaxID=157278 RepID=UPI0035CA498A